MVTQKTANCISGSGHNSQRSCGLWPQKVTLGPFPANYLWFLSQFISRLLAPWCNLMNQLVFPPVLSGTVLIKDQQRVMYNAPLNMTHPHWHQLGTIFWVLKHIIFGGNAPQQFKSSFNWNRTSSTLVEVASPWPPNILCRHPHVATKF